MTSGPKNISKTDGRRLSHGRSESKNRVDVLTSIAPTTIEILRFTNLAY